MTSQEVKEMIGKSEQRVEQLQEMGAYDTRMKNYHQGYQDALRTILIRVQFDEQFDALVLKAAQRKAAKK